jgi:UPF0042 nucleotide-binding protein
VNEEKNSEAGPDNVDTNNSNLQLVIITGVSGGGKSSTLRMLEDYGFFCVDNFIPALLIPFVKLISTQFNMIAVVVDTRGGIFFSDLNKEIKSLKELGFIYRVLFLDASDETLIKRFSETRRRHPLLSEESALLDSIQMERAMLDEIKIYADDIIDTSELSLGQLKQIISNTLIDKKLSTSSMRISIMSFGYKYGLPIDADLIFDVRFLPNPHYIPELKPHTGLEQSVRDYVFNKDVTQQFLKKFLDFITYLVPHYKEEGKSLLTVAIGCTGGRHRSVAIANRLCEELKSLSYYVVEKHRDISRNQEYYQKKP